VFRLEVMVVVAVGVMEEVERVFVCPRCQRPCLVVTESGVFCRECGYREDGGEE